jgi:hypothetical protein
MSQTCQGSVRPFVNGKSIGGPLRVCGKSMRYRAPGAAFPTTCSVYQKNVGEIGPCCALASGRGPHFAPRADFLVRWPDFSFEDWESVPVYEKKEGEARQRWTRWALSEEGRWGEVPHHGGLRRLAGTR